MEFDLLKSTHWLVKSCLEFTAKFISQVLDVQNMEVEIM
jgi:hypothetical protein